MRISDLIAHICGVCLIWYLWVSIQVFSYRPETTEARMVDQTKTIYEFNVNDTLYRGSPVFAHRGESVPSFIVNGTTELRYDHLKYGDKVEICFSPHDPRDFAVRNKDALACTPDIPAKLSVLFRWLLLPIILPMVLPLVVIYGVFNALIYSFTGQEGPFPGMDIVWPLILAGTRLG